MHTMCSYHGMFPARLAHYFIQMYSSPGDLVADPFSGRGTVALQARVEGRRSLSGDLSPLGFVLTAAKSEPPGWHRMEEYIARLQEGYLAKRESRRASAPEDIEMLYHPTTLDQIVYLRNGLLRSVITDWSAEQFVLAGSLAGIMHGSQRRDGSSQFLSIGMPNTFSMSPGYVRRYIDENSLAAPEQDVFERLRDKLARLYLDDPAGVQGKAYNVEASELLNGTLVSPGTVDLVITSPPYLGVVNYGASNWIRLWLLGVDDVGRDGGAGRRSLDALLDHRHTYHSYVVFMERTLQSVERALAPNGVAVVVVGDVATPGQAALPLARRIWDQVGSRTGLKLVEVIEDDLPAQNKVSRIWGETKGQATDRDCALVLVRADRSGTPRPRKVLWDECYKDAGPDAAHARLHQVRAEL